MPRNKFKFGRTPPEFEMIQQKKADEENLRQIQLQILADEEFNRIHAGEIQNDRERRGHGCEVYSSEPTVGQQPAKKRIGGGYFSYLNRIVGAKAFDATHRVNLPAGAIVYGENVGHEGSPVLQVQGGKLVEVGWNKPGERMTPIRWEDINTRRHKGR